MQIAIASQRQILPPMRSRRMNQRVWAISLMMWPLLSSSLWAQVFTIRGEVMNGTTGQLSHIDEVRLIELKNGMKIKTVLRDLEGHYTFEDIDLDLNVPHLVQVNYKGINYSTPLLLDDLSEPIRTTVFETTTSRKNIRVRHAHWVLVKEKNRLRVEKLFILENVSRTPKTFLDPKETFRYFLPRDILEPPLVSASSGSMPIKVASAPVEGTAFYSIAYPIKPGQTQIEIKYQVPYPGNYSFEETLPYRIKKIECVSSPLDMSVESGQLMRKDAREDMDAALFEGGPFKKGDLLRIQLQGGSDPKEPQIISIPNRTQSLLIPIAIALTLILTIGIILGVWRKNSQNTVLEMEKLFQRLIRLEMQYHEEAISPQEFQEMKILIQSKMIWLKNQMDLKK